MYIHALIRSNGAYNIYSKELHDYIRGTLIGYSALITSYPNCVHTSYIDCCSSSLLSPFVLDLSLISL